MPASFNSTSRFRQDLNQSFELQSLAQRGKAFYENKQFMAEAVKNDGLNPALKHESNRQGSAQGYREFFILI